MNIISFRFFLSVILALFLVARGGGGSGDNTTSTPTSVGEVTGQVLDFSTGLSISAATVSASGQSTSTAADGTYTLSNVDLGERVIVTVSRPGYAEHTKLVRLTDQEPIANLPVSLLPIGMTQTFDPAVAQTITMPNSPASVMLSANSLVKSDGSPADGNVSIDMTVINPTADIDLMPGDMKTDTGGGVLAPIESFGAITVTFSDANNNDLNLVAGSNATIRIPLADKSGAPPASIPLYFFDKSQGLWVEEGSANLVTDPGGDYYQGTVSHFSTWNADILYPQIRINGCVVDSNGAFLEGVSVISEGDNYSGTASTVTDSLGAFSVIAKPNASVIVFGLQSGTLTNTLKLQTLDSDLIVSECLVINTANNIGDAAVSIKLSWGEFPLDLDAHLFGPNMIHVYFGDQGSLVNFPFAQLDVDDIFSFGPEIITIFNFPVEGTYQYVVNNFLETFTPGMTESPARIELNVDGNITVFTPPPGEGNNLNWEVFNFIVASDGSFTVVPVNQWLP